MKTSPHACRGRRTLLLLAAVAAALPRSAPAQIAAPPPPAAPAAPAHTGDVVQLSPFEVVSDTTDTYEATNTAALTGTSTPLNKAPLDARILNRTLISELGGGDIYTLLSDYGGIGPMISGVGSEGQRGLQDGDGAQPGGLTSRGFTISEPRRDGFLRSSTSMFNAFDVESAEAINGSNNLLYGSGEAGGVVVINSKRARVQQRSYQFNYKIDSEGSREFTTDLNASTRRFAVRLNLLKSEDKYYRPLLGLNQEAIQGAVTFRPYSWLSIFADYRHYIRDAPSSRDGTINAPLNLLLNTGERLHNQSTRYIVGVGGTELTNGFMNLTTMDSLWGKMNGQYWVNESKSVTVDVTPRPDLAFQFKYSDDSRINNALSAGLGTIYHPDSTANLYVDANGVPKREWAILMQLNSGPFWTGARGYRATAVGKRNLGRWGEHTLSGFLSYLESWNNRQEHRFYELDGSGRVIQDLANITNADSGRNLMPAVWMPAFTPTLVAGARWPANEVLHPNGKRYHRLPVAYAGAVPRTAANPMGISGPINTTSTALPIGSPTSSYTLDDTLEESFGFSLNSSYWRGRIDTMVGMRFESAETVRVSTGAAKGPIDYDSHTFGVVADTPINGIRAYGSYSTNSKIAFNTDRDIFNQLLPIGKGNTVEGGLKLALWDHRVSGNITYYVTEGENFTGSLGTVRNDVDPDGINGRNGGAGFIYSKISDGLSASISMRPLKPWQVTVSLTQANGSERSTVSLPIFYNDEFNTTTAGGQQVVAIKGSTGALSALLVPSVPGNPASAQIPLSIAMLKDPTSPYFAQLDAESGQILNAVALGMKTTGVGTTRTGLPITQHQLGFAPPANPIIVRQKGEATTGYAENQFSMINRFQISEGRFRGLVLGVANVYRRGFRAYMYTDAAGGNRRKIYYYPDKLDTNAYAIYSFRPMKAMRAAVQVNVSNVFDRQQVITLLRQTNGTARFFQHYYTPRKIQFTTSLTF
ncbi:MAG: TonB-dependent receptor [Verrucomicrobia bacterium]|nr:TonB-dependent receptor [Verrucomicrobiota bacterium]